MTALSAEEEFDALVLDTKRMQHDAQAGNVQDLRSDLLLRQRLLLISDDILQAFALYKSIERFKALGEGSFQGQAAREAEKVFAPMVFFLNRDEDILRGAKREIVNAAREAMLADTQTLAAAVQKLEQDCRFYRETLENLLQTRDLEKNRDSEDKQYH